MKKNIGQYDIEYQNCPCFWGTEPAKFVKKANKYFSDCSNFNALDIGAGEGKNTFYLNSLGFKVTAIEISFNATRNFLEEALRRQNLGEDISNIIIHRANGLNLNISESFDLIVSYGMLHCLKDFNEIENHINDLKAMTKSNGIHIVSAFTNKLPLPSVQSYMNPVFLDEDFILSQYTGWEILEFESDIIEHTHPTHEESHKHSLFRLITKNIN